MESFDYIIVGAGSAGCVLANRLTANGRNRVLLLEAGPRDTNPWIKLPAGMGRLFTNGKVNWRYYSDPEPGLENRRIFFPRGKVLGGSSSINGHVYMRGVPSDYDAWAQTGLKGWGWDDVLPYFLKSEDHFAGASPLHGAGGELTVSPLKNPHQTSQDFVAAAQSLGLPFNADFNGPAQDGVGYLQFTLRNGMRCSAATAFLNPAKSRANLRIETGFLVERVLIEGGRATGLRYRGKAGTVTVRAKEVILSAGTINSPQLLMLSGIGDPAELGRHGIDVVTALPSVGQNLQDHIYVHCMARVQPKSSVNRIVSNNLRLIPEVLRYALWRDGLLLTAAAQVGLFQRTGPHVESPDLQAQFRPFSMAVSKDGKFASEAEPYVTASCSCIRPQSRGRLWLESSDPAAAPHMVANFLTAEADQQVLIAGLKLIRRIYAAQPMAGHVVAERTPGVDVQSDAELLAYIRANAQSMYHPVGTCRMGADAASVVDAQLRVRGVAGLRVVDASVMPSIPSGNTNAPTIMLAEKAADLILGAA